MTTFTWIGGTSDWATAANWTPSVPPGAADIAQADTPSTIFGSGTAAQFQTTNQSGLVTLAGVFNLGTIFNGAEMSLEGSITSQFIESFVSLNITGAITASASLSVPDNGILQGNGAVVIENGGSVDASSYTMNYNPGSLDQPNHSSLTIDGGDGGASLVIASVATVDASNQIVGGFGMLTAGTVDVENAGGLSTTYLSIEADGADLNVDGSELDVTQTSTDPDGVAGINLTAGTLEISNDGSLLSTFLFQEGTNTVFSVNHSTATISAPDDTINGIDVLDGLVSFSNDASVSASQLHLESPGSGTSEPFLSIDASSLDIIGTGTVEGLSFSGLWLADGAADILNNSHVTTPQLEIDSPEVDDPANVLGAGVTIESASTVSVANSVILGVTNGSSVELVLKDADTLLEWGDQLIVGDGSGDGEGATAILFVTAGAAVSVDNTEDAPGLLVVGGKHGDTGDVEVSDDGSKLTATGAIIGDAGIGSLFATVGGSIDVTGTLSVGEEFGGTGTLQLAGADGSASATVGELDVGASGDGTLLFSSLNGLNSGTLTVAGDAFVGTFDGGTGTVFAHGGSFGVGGTLIVGDEGSAEVDLDSSTLDVGGDLIIGNGGSAAVMSLNDVDLTLSGDLDVGEDGKGVLDWGSSSTQSTSLDQVIVGASENGDGTFTVEDPTTLLTFGTLAVGAAGSGTLNVYNGATVVVTDDAGLGIEAGGQGAIFVQTGTDDFGVPFPNGGSGIVFDKDLFVGDGGTGGLFIGSADNDGNGGIASVSGDLIIGNEATAFGTVDVGDTFVNSDGSTVASSLTVDQDIIVGVDATGTLDVSTGTFDPGGLMQLANSATVDATADGFGLVDIAQGVSSTGSVDIDDSLLNANTLEVGDAGLGDLAIVNGTVDIAGDIVVGDKAGSRGTIDIEGDALLHADGSLIIGADATPIVNGGSIEYPAELDATDGATVENTGTGDDDGFFIGLDPHSLGKAIVDGGTLDVNDAVIGEDGSGVLEILNASTATFNGDLTLGDGTAAFGGIDISDSDVDFFGTIDVAEDATGATIGGTFIPGAMLTIENGSTVIDQDFNGIEIGVGAGSNGQMIVDDSDVEPTFITVGDAGTGTLTIRNDGSVIVDPDQDVEIASAPSSSGTVTVDGATLSYGSELDVGSGGNGSLSITNDGTAGPNKTVDDSDVVIGDDDTAVGAAIVDDSFLFTNDITIGNSGAGSLTIQNDGTVDTKGDAIIASNGSVFGEAGSGTGTVTLIGLGGTVDDTLWKIEGQLAVGDFGNGTLAVQDGATVTVGDEFDVADESNGFTDVGSGYVNEFGSNSLIEAKSALFVGGDGKGTLAVAGGAVFIAADDATFGDGINSAGSLLIAGGTYRQTGGDVVIGEQGTGFAQVAFGGDFNAGTSSVTLGDTDLGKGTLNLVTVGSGNPTAETGDLTVGEEGSGSVNVTGNGLFTTDGDAVIGDTGEGNVTIDGLNATGTFAPATWNVSGDLSIGGLTTAGGGVGTLTVANNGVVHVAGELVQWNLGSIIDNSVTAGLIEIGGTTLASGSGIVIDAAIVATASHAATPQGTLSGGGTIKANILDNGLVDLTNGQTLVVDGSVSGTGTLLLDGTAVLQVLGAIASTVTIDFQTGPGQRDVLELNTPLAVQGTIHDMGAGDAIDLPGVKFAAAGFSVTNDVLTITNNGSVAANLALSGNYSSGSFSLQKDGSGNANIVFGNPPVGAPALIMPAELPAFPLSFQEYLTGISGIYVTDPNAPVNSTYTLTLNDKTGTMFLLPNIANTQTDVAGAHPMVFIGSLAQIDADLNNVIYSSGGSAFAGEAAPPDTITVSLVRGDGVTETGAIGFDPAISNASIVYNGPTTVALGQAIALSFAPSDPYASFPGEDDFGASINTSANNRNEAPFNGYLLDIGQFAAQGGVNAFYLNDESAPLAELTNDLGAGNLLFVPTATGTVPIDGSFFEYNTGNSTVASAATALFSVGVTVTAATRTKAVIDTWTGAVSALLSAPGNWSQGFAPGTTDTAVFAPLTPPSVIVTTGGGVAGAWDIDTSTRFAGVVDATGTTSGAAFDIDQGATATFLDGSGLFAASLFNSAIDGEPLAAIRGNPVIVGDTAPSALVASNADLTTGEVTIGNSAAAGGSHMTLTNVFWAPEGNTVTGNPGDVLVGNNGYGVLTLINTDVDNVEAQNFQAAGFGQIQIGQDNPGAAGSGGLGLFFDDLIKDSVQVGFFGPGELAMGGGSIGNAINIQFVSLAVLGGRVDWGGGATLYITSGLAGVDPATVGGNSIVSGDDWTIQSVGNGPGLTNDGTIEAAAGGGGASTIEGINVSGTGTILIDAGATIDLQPGGASPILISSGQTVVFAPEFNGQGGLLTIGEPGNFAGTIEAFADGDRIAVPAGDQTPSVTSATYNAATNTTVVDIAITEDGSISFGGAITFGGSLDAGNFVVDPVAPAGFTVFDYAESGVKAQPPIIAAPADMTASDGVANLIPGLSLSDQNAARNNRNVTLTLTPVSAPAGTFSAPAAAGLTITGDNTQTITLSGGLAIVQAELAKIGFTPVAGSDEYIQATASDGVTNAAPLTFLAHNSASGLTAGFTGTENYIYSGPATGSFDAPGVWQDGSGHGFPSGPGIADSATIVSNPLTGGEDVLGGIGVAGQLLTEGLVVLTGSLTLAGLPIAGIGTVQGTGPAFAGALEAGQGNLILGSSAYLALGGDLIVTGELDSIDDNPWSVAGNVHLNGGTLALGGLGALAVTGTVALAGAGELEIMGSPGATAGSSPILRSAAALIGAGAGTAVVNVANVASLQAWAIAGALVVGASGDAEMAVGAAGFASSVPAVAASTVTVARSSGVTAALSVWAGATLAVAANLTVGASGTGSLMVTDGPVDTQNDGGGTVLVGSAASPGELDIGAAAGGVGTVDISVNGAIKVDGAAYLGGTSAGASGGTGLVEVSSDSFFPSDGGLFDVTGGFTAYSGTVLLREGTAAFGSLTIAAGATLTGDGFVNGPGVETGNLSNPTTINTTAPLTTIADNGLIDASVDPGNGAAALTLYGSVSGTGTLEIAAGATLDIEGTVAASLHVAFDGPGGLLILSQPGSFGPAIGGFQAGDEIRMPGIAPGTVAYNASTGSLTDTVAGTVYSFTFDPPSGSFAAASDTHDGTLLELTAGPVITVPATLDLGVGQPRQIQGVSLAGTSAETNDTFSVTLSDISGLLSASGAGVSGSESKSLTMTGSIGAINAALLTLSDTDLTAPSDTITVNATDVTQPIAAPAGTIAVTVVGAPVLTVPGEVTVGAGLSTKITGVSLAAANNPPAETFAVTLADTNGDLAATQAGAATVGGSGTTTLTISGVLQDVNNTLLSLSDTDAVSPSDTITANAKDQFGNTATQQAIGVTVSNATPQLAGQIVLAAAAQDVALPDATEVASFTDTLMSDTAAAFTAMVNWGDGATTTGTIVGSNGTFQVDAGHTYAGAGTFPLGVTITDTLDGFGLPLTGSLTVNGLPAISAPATAAIVQGNSATIGGISLAESGVTTGETFLVTLTDTDGLLSASGAGVSGANTTTLTLRGSLAQVKAGLLTLSEADAVAGADPIAIAASDGFGNVGSGTIAVTVSPLLPEIAAPATASIVQGSSAAIGGVSLAETDNVAGETFSVTLTDTNGLLSASGLGVSGASSHILTIGGSLAQVKANLGTLTDTNLTTGSDPIVVSAEDSFGNLANGTIDVTVSASGPQLAGKIVLTAATSDTPLSGSTELATFTDTNLADTAATFLTTVDWGDGSAPAEATITGADGSFTINGGHTYAVGGAHTLSVTIDDTRDGAELPLTGTVATADGNVLVGQGVVFAAGAGVAFSGTVAGFTDADTVSLASDFAANIDWGDGSALTVGTITGSDGSFSVSGEHTYASPGQDPVTVTVTDAPPGTASAIATGTADVAPQLAGRIVLTAATADTPLPGSTELATFTDTNLADTPAGFDATIDWGDGTPSTAATITGGDGSFTVDGGHTYAEPGSYILGVSIGDTEDGAQLPLTGTVVAVDGNVLAGQGVTLHPTAGVALSGEVATFTDTDLLTPASGLMAVINWGDGTPVTSATITGGDGTFAASGGHTYAGPGEDAITVTVRDAAPGTASTSVSDTVEVGQIFTLTKGVDSVTGGSGEDTIDATTNTLSAGDTIDGGAGGANTLNLIGAGLFNLKLPATLANIQVINAQEGQAAYAGGGQSFAATNQVITLRDGLNLTVDVAPAVLNAANPKPATITVNGANDASVIDLASGNDTVTVGGSAETVHGGSGNDQIQVTASTIGATIDGGAGNSTLTVTGGGSIVMGPSVTDISGVLLAATPNAMSFIANGISGLVVTDESQGPDMVMAGGLNQTLTGGAGREMFVGFSGGATTFRDTAAAFNGDTIGGFLAAGDKIDFTDVSFASLSNGFVENGGGTAGILSVSDGIHSAAVTLNGVFSRANFHAAPDGGSGTLIAYS